MHTAAERELTALGIALLVVLVVLVLVATSSDRAHLDPRSRAWRWLNLLTPGLVVVLAIDLLPDLAEETEWAHRADEVVIEALAGLAIAWFAFRRQRLARSLTPLALVAVVEVVKLVAIPVELGDTPDVKGDIVLAAIGVPVLSALALVYARAWRRWRPAPE